MNGVQLVQREILRFVLAPNLEIYLRAREIVAPNIMQQQPQQALWTPTHDNSVQKKRAGTRVLCPPGGVVHDYVPFYFGHHSPTMLANVTGYNGIKKQNQDHFVFIAIKIGDVAQCPQLQFVFTDGHAIAAFTDWFNDLSRLSELDWKVIDDNYFSNTFEDGDRKRRKQSEFLIYERVPWHIVSRLIVRNQTMKTHVESLVQQAGLNTPVEIDSSYYFWGK